MLVGTPDYWSGYLAGHPLAGNDGGLERLFNELSAYERRMLELAVIDHCHPALNTSSVTFNASWVPGASGPVSLPTPVDVVLGDGSRMPLNSINRAATLLQVDRTTIDSALHLHKPIWSNAHQAQVTVVPGTAAPIEADVPVSTIPFSFDDLPLDRVSVFSKAWDLVGTESTLEDCVERYHVSSHAVRTYVGRRFIIGVLGGVSTLLFFAQHPHKLPR